LAKLDIVKSKSNIAPGVANLILSIVYSDVVKYRASAAVQLMVPACNLKWKKVLDLLNKIQLFTTCNQVQRSLAPNDEPETVLYAQFLANFGEMFIPAVGDLKIPGMPESALQFILHKPPKKSLDKFEKHMSKTKDLSTLLFHGTALSSLQSILRKGFELSYDRRFGAGSFFAEDPYVSYWFASARILHLALQWVQSPYKAHGLCLVVKSLAKEDMSKWKVEEYT
jgi:hypothetical protein